MENLLTMAEASKILSVSPDTIRRWDKKGLIRTIRSEFNHRLFNLGELHRLCNKISGKHEGNKYKILKTKKRSPYTVIELFAGAGGTALGFDHAGLKHTLLADFNKDSIETIKKNKPKWNAIVKDITEMDFNGLQADVCRRRLSMSIVQLCWQKIGF